MDTSIDPVVELRVALETEIHGEGGVKGQLAFVLP